jgi:hypothetical protein
MIAKLNRLKQEIKDLEGKIVDGDKFEYDTKHPGLFVLVRI